LKACHSSELSFVSFSDEMFFFVMSGELLVHDIGFGDSQKAELVLKEGDHFGELNLVNIYVALLLDCSVSVFSSAHCGSYILSRPLDTSL